MAIRRLTVSNIKSQTRGHPVRLATNVHSRGITVVIYVFLVGINLAVFGQTVRHDFVNFDDDLYVYNTPAIRAGLTIQGIAQAFVSPHAGNWHPLATISHMLDCQLYGLNAGGHHATNVILHTIAALLLFCLLRQMTGAIWKSAIVAALFAVHPLHVESVAWVSERKDVLSAVFFMLTLIAYVRYVRTPSNARYLTVAIMFTFGLMSKSMLISTPCVLLLLDYWPLNRFKQFPSTGDATISGCDDQTQTIGRLFLEKVPLFVLSAAAGAITFILQKRATGAIPPLPFLWRVENAVASYPIYLWQTLRPTGLAVFYPHPNGSLEIWQVILATGFLLTITTAAMVLRRRQPYLFTGWFWYLVMLVPVIGIVQVGEQRHADHTEQQRDRPRAKRLVHRRRLHRHHRGILERVAGGRCQRALHAGRAHDVAHAPERPDDLGDRWRGLVPAARRPDRGHPSQRPRLLRAR